MMKTAVILAGLFLVLVAAKDKKDCPLMKALQDGIDKCVDELEPSEETLDLVANEKGEDREEVRCFMACMMKKAGLMTDAKFNFERMDELLRSANDPDENEIEKITQLMKNCKEEAEVSDDDCEVAANYAKCAKASKESEK